MDVHTLGAQIKEITQQLAKRPRLPDAAAIEAFRVRYVSKKSVIAQLFQQFKALDVDAKRQLAPQLNALKDKAFAYLKEASAETTTLGPKHSTPSSMSQGRPTDLSLPPVRTPLGARHPLQHVMTQALSYFEQLGFEIADGPEIENDWYNFSALHFPEHHPARDMQDTFFLSLNDSQNKPYVLRTHTSSVQVRMMERYAPPLRMVMPGRVYRNEAVTARSHYFFHQIEGLYIDQDVSFIDMKQTLTQFVHSFFNTELPVRLRPSYFPFTEPSAEMDLACLSCQGKGCKLCKESGWLEVAGCGMVDPAVLENCGLDPERYSGYAFGMGIDRLTLMRYGITDIRVLSQNDVRVLRQFSCNDKLS